MKVIVIGATGTIGASVANPLAEKGHEVIRASRRGETRVDIREPDSISAMFDKIWNPDAVVCCAGDAVFKPFAELTEGDYEVGLRSKLLGQVSLARIAKDHLRDGGSITLTAGSLAREPMPGSAAISLVNAGLEGFIRAAALEMLQGIRINVVSPPWVTETLVKFGMDPSIGLAASEVAKAYVAAVEGSYDGVVLDPRQLR